MDEIVITAGGKPGAYRGEPGVYPATLVTHTIEGPFKSKQTGKEDETFKLHEWGFFLEGAPDDEGMVWITSGESTGPKSKTFGILTALMDGREPPVGTKLDINKHLLGRMALVDVRKNERGYLDAVGVTPMPKAMGSKAAAPPPAQPVAVGAGAPTVAQSGNELPF